MHGEPDLDEIDRLLRERLATGDQDESQSVVVVLSLQQLRRLAEVLGWVASPTLGECLDRRRSLCCPRCSAAVSSMLAEASLTAAARLQEAATPNRFAVTVRDRTPADVERWWVRCEQCDLRFDLPPEVGYV